MSGVSCRDRQKRQRPRWGPCWLVLEIRLDRGALSLGAALQAVAELGPPDKQAKTSDGTTVADWIEHRNGGSSFSLGTGFYSGHSGVAIGHTVGSGYQDRVTRLTFGQDSKLVSWSKNY